MVTLRDLRLDDIPLMLNYWYGSPPGFIENLGVDPTKMGTRDEWEASIRERLQTRPAKPGGVIILYHGKPVGQHAINPVIEGDHGIFHAHIWDSSLRGRGIGLQSYVLAGKLFMERFDLQRIVYKTPVQNLASIRVKEKLGIRLVGEEIIGFGIVKEGTVAKVFEATRAEMDRLHARLTQGTSGHA